MLTQTYELTQRPRSKGEFALVTSQTVAGAMGREHADVIRTMSELHSADYIAGETSIDQRTGEIVLEAVHVREKGLQQVAGWPGPADQGAASRLLAELERAIEQADSPEQRTKLERLREAASTVGSRTLAEVLGRVLSGQV